MFNIDFQDGGHGCILGFPIKTILATFDLRFIILGFNNISTLFVILCHLPEKGRREIEEIKEEMKERDMGESQRGKWMKVKKQKK